ncbi:CIA30 family protein [Ancylomarina euxinus]|uniref:CIA30 family protein n=1 Tax=Ancylomarina euxinus TaxID=2283627 RepID=A0A425Y041_9BACT|nr:CIA30 family protein [Ancylomarina euxinus]MCZ4695431.1 CIA30 family protein [Ancylomarina euxinus]MUP15627.1 CIA30 family protein [Ancylomarina euxinus]RRG20934.1 CIA30 family protein [Ancylomarina euxinus]
MKTLTLIICMMMVNDFTLFYFNKESEISNWTVVNDVVMGGRSEADFALNSEGNGVFSGQVSLENNGGFSSVRYRFESLDVTKYKKVILKLKGDGKAYQFRLKSDLNHAHSFVKDFQTAGEWESIEINFEDMYPRFRGRILNMPNYPGENMCEIAFLIANKRAEAFRLEIESISLK